MMRPLTFAIAGLALASCSERHAGGSTGVETTNGVVAIALHDSLDLPTFAARVVARPADWQVGQALPLDSSLLETTTDSAGKAVFRDLPAGPWRFEMIQGRWAAQFLGRPSSESETTRIRLQRMGALHGKVAPRSRVVLVGLRHATVSDSSGDFRFDSLPAGTVDIRTPHDGARGYAGVPTGSSTDAPPLRADIPGTTILDDFQDGDTRMRFAPVTGGGWWYASAAAGMVVSPTGITESTHLGILTDSVTANRTFLIRTIRDTATYPWTEIGFDLGTQRGNLTGLRALVVRARGAGIWSLRVRTLDASGAAILWQRSLRMDSAWTNWRVLVDSLAVGSRRWDAAAPGTLSRTTSLSLQNLDEGWIEFDEIGLEGPQPHEIWPGVVMP